MSDPNPADENLEILSLVADALGPLRESLVFVGGSFGTSAPLRPPPAAACASPAAAEKGPRPLAHANLPLLHCPLPFPSRIPLPIRCRSARLHPIPIVHAAST